jgi:hypothetical protein
MAPQQCHILANSEILFGCYHDRSHPVSFWHSSLWMPIADSLVLQNDTPIPLTDVLESFFISGTLAEGPIAVAGINDPIILWF